MTEIYTSDQVREILRKNDNDWREKSIISRVIFFDENGIGKTLIIKKILHEPNGLIIEVTNK